MNIQLEDWSYSVSFPVVSWLGLKSIGLCVCFLLLRFHALHGVLKARILKWLAIPFSSGPCFVRTLHHDLSDLGGPTQHVS